MKSMYQEPWRHLPRASPTARFGFHDYCRTKDAAEDINLHTTGHRTDPEIKLSPVLWKSHFPSVVRKSPR